MERTGRRYKRPVAPFELWRLAGNEGAKPELVAAFPTRGSAQIFARSLYRVMKTQFRASNVERNAARYYSPIDARDNQHVRYIVMYRPRRKVQLTHVADKWELIHADDLYANELISEPKEEKGQ